MDLKTKLSMLSGNDDFEQDLAGISTSPHEETPIESGENQDGVVDFKLGALSIDTYLKEAGISEKRPKKSTKKTESKRTSKRFDDIFAGIDDDEDSEDLGQYRTGNRDLDQTTARSRRLLEQSDLLAADDFDAFLDDDRLGEEEDVEMRNNLVAMGRRYARDSAMSKESSEISKTFAESETKLKALFDEVSRDKASIERDIERMRVPGRGGKTLSDMISAKNSYHSTQLQIIKEINAIKKTSFDLRAKEQARKEAENAGSSDISANTIQSIFGSSRAGIMTGIGGYGGVSGAGSDYDSEDSLDETTEEDDEVIMRKYFRDKPTTESDGDKWLRYEDRDVHYVIIVDENPKDNSILELFAEDRDGNRILDYPLPDVNNLTFEIDRIGKTASDNLHRNYVVRFA